MKIDLTNIDEADDGSTTHFGGYYTIDGVEHDAGGNDRGWKVPDEYFEDLQDQNSQVD